MGLSSRIATMLSCTLPLIAAAALLPASRAAAAPPDGSDWRAEASAHFLNTPYYGTSSGSTSISARHANSRRGKTAIGTRSLTTTPASSLPPSPWALYNTAQVVSTGGNPDWVIQTTSKNDATQPYGVTGGNIYYTPTSPITFSQVTQMSLDWKAVTPWGGGSPRISIAVDVDGDGEFHPWYANPPGNDGWFFVFIVDGYPNFYGPASNWQNTGNLIGNNSPALYDTGQIHVDLDGDGTWDGTTVDNYNHALAMVGNKHVFAIQVVTDGGWFVPRYGIDEQVVWQNNVNINGNVLTAHAPLTANNDSYSVVQNSTLTVSAPGVLANDGNPSGVTTYAVNASSPANGNLTPNVNGSFTYTPNPGYVGSDSFTYQISDGNFTYNTTTVNLMVLPLPSATNDSADIGKNSAATYLNVLSNDSSNGGGPLSIVSASSAAHGTVAIASGGYVTYKPTNSYQGTDSFSYTISNGNGTATAVVNVTVRNGNSLKGKVTTSTGAAIAGVAVSISGSAALGVTDSSGAYTICGLNAGAYTVTPSKAPYTFTPAGKTVNVSGNVNNVNFIGTLP
jgi:hypothetical protein